METSFMFKEHWTNKLRESLSNISLKYSSIHSVRSSLRRPFQEYEDETARLPAKEISQITSIEESIVQSSKDENDNDYNYYEYTDDVKLKNIWTNLSIKCHTTCKLFILIYFFLFPPDTINFQKRWYFESFGLGLFTF